MTQDCYRAWDYGPVADGLYHAIKNNPNFDPGFVEMFNHVAKFAGDYKNKKSDVMDIVAIAQAAHADSGMLEYIKEQLAVEEALF